MQERLSQAKTWSSKAWREMTQDQALPPDPNAQPPAFTQVTPAAPAYATPHQQQARVETRTVTYKGEAAYKHGVAHMQRQGWSVTNTAVSQPRVGCMRFLMLGFFSLIFKPKQHFIVNYQRYA